MQKYKRCPTPLVHDRLVCHWVVGAGSDVEVWLWGFDLARYSVEPIGTTGQVAQVAGDQDELDRQEMQ